MKNNTQLYFNSLANNYENLSNKGIWNLVRLLEKHTLLNYVKKKKFNKILELGCGSGYYTKYLTSFTKNKITCVDFSGEMLKNFCDSKVIKINQDIEKFKDNNIYDLIFCAGAIEFLKEPYSVFKNVSTMLSAEGSFIILVPRKNILAFIYKLFHKHNKVKINLFEKKDISNFCNINNLKISKVNKIFPFSHSFIINKIKI